MEEDRSQLFRARALDVEPVQNTLEPALSLSVSLIKMLKFEFEPTLSLLNNYARSTSNWL